MANGDGVNYNVSYTFYFPVSNRLNVPFRKCNRNENIFGFFVKI